MSGPFEDGERVLLIDGRGRRYLVMLRSGGVFHMHTGTLPHDLIIGSPEGTRVESSGGMELTCFRPTLVDFVLKMPRGAQVVYPKDLGAIVVYADIFPGARVLEAGTGSGALTIALCRATGSEGRVVSYDVRPEFQAKAAANVESFFGKLPAWLELREGDLRDVVTGGESFERAILDMPEPWTMLGAIDHVLVPGGIVCGFLPTTGQVQSFVLGLESAGYEQVESFETMLRPWHVTERSVRPDHRMVAHTGFITVARRTSPRVPAANRSIPEDIPRG